MYDIYVDGKSCVRNGILPISRPNISAPVKKINEYEVLGRDGKLYEDTEFYEDIEISVSFNYMVDKNRWFEMFRRCKKFFKNVKELQFSDDVNFYYRIKKVDIKTDERTSKRLGKFDVTFIFDPYTYLINGKNKIPLQKNLMNFFEKCKPIYLIHGEGLCNLNVNGHVAICNVSGTLKIDTDLKLSYRDNGELANTAVKCDYDELVFKEENNTLSATDGFVVEIIPNWRCI